MPKSVLGINMGNHSIKVVEMTRRGNSFVVQNLLIAPTKEAIVSGEMIQPDVVAATLKELLKSSGVRTKDAVISIGGQSGVVVRVTELPKMPKKELVKAIPLEIERHLPFQSGGAIRDYAILKEPEEVSEGEQIPVLFAAARADLVDAYLVAVQQSGLSPLAIEVEPLAAVRALFAARGFGLSDGQQRRVSVLVNIGYEGTEISFVSEGNLIFTRLVPFGGRHLTEDIRDQLGMDLEEAERVKIEHGTAWIERPEAPPAPATPTALEAQVIPTATQPLPSVVTPPSQPSEEGIPSLTFELPTEPKTSQPSEMTISFELPTEPTHPTESEKKAETKDLGLDFSLPLPGEQPSVQEIQPSAPSLEFVPGQMAPEFGIQSVPSPVSEEWVPTPTPSEALPIEELVYNAISPRLMELAGEISRSIEFLMSQRPNVIVDEVYLLGGGAMLRDLDRFLQNQLGMPVVRLNPFKYMDVSPVTLRMGRDYVDQVGATFAIAVGLALWAYL
ncbi:MAG: type IV pilus assembly protein PilM [Armatimonadetes bacterium]|nr:type IV pilus assembly protein PilM [Armatimonadota bacterium]MDW8028684.1 type IV pilus assembly protein PilM [Armatimonadota bacterium]